MQRQHRFKRFYEVKTPAGEAPMMNLLVITNMNTNSKGGRPTNSSKLPPPRTYGPLFPPLQRVFPNTKVRTESATGLFLMFPRCHKTVWRSATELFLMFLPKILNYSLGQAQAKQRAGTLSEGALMRPRAALPGFGGKTRFTDTMSF